MASPINQPTDPEDVKRAVALAKNAKPNGKAFEEAIASRIHCFAEIPDLLSMNIPPIEWLVDGIIARGTLTLWAGTDGTAKTFLAQKMALAVASGDHFLGRQCFAASVLYLDYENPNFAVRERLELLTGSDKLNPQFRVWGTWLEHQPPPIGSEGLYQIVKEVRPLLIVDPFRYAHTAEENDSTQMMLVMQALRSYAAAGAAVIILHHPAKTEGSTGRGSSAIRGAVDVAFLQEMSEETDLITLRCVKNRFGERLTVTIKPDFDAGTFEVTDSPAFTKRQQEIERLRQVIAENPGMSKSKIQAMHGGKRTRVFKLLSEHEGQLWEARPDGQSLRYFPPALNQFPQKGTGVGTGEPVEGTRTSSPVPFPYKGTGGNCVPHNPVPSTQFPGHGTGHEESVQSDRLRAVPKAIRFPLLGWHEELRLLRSEQRGNTVSASQRRKGKGGEQEVVNLARAHGLDARRTWENAMAPDAVSRCTDVIIHHQRAQVKRRARAWKDLYLALCGVDLVVCRSDNAPWLIVQRFEDWLRCAKEVL